MIKSEMVNKTLSVPLIMRNDKTGLCLLVTGENYNCGDRLEGVVVIGTERNNVGEYSKDWLKCTFKEFTGKIEIQNVEY